MITMALIIIGIIFLFGLVQWARSGAVLWNIHELTKYRHGSSSGAADLVEMDRQERARKRETLRKSVQLMEITMDELLKSSFKVLGVVALFVWLFVAFTVFVDLLGFNWWQDRPGFSNNRVIGNPTARAWQRSGSGSGFRSDTFRSMGSGFRLR